MAILGPSNHAKPERGPWLLLEHRKMRRNSYDRRRCGLRLYDDHGPDRPLEHPHDPVVRSRDGTAFGRGTGTALVPRSPSGRLPAMTPVDMTSRRPWRTHSCVPRRYSCRRWNPKRTVGGGSHKYCRARVCGAGPRPARRDTNSTQPGGLGARRSLRGCPTPAL